MVSRLLVRLVAGAVLAVTLGSCGDGGSTPSGDLTAFCKVLGGPPPTAAFRDPTDNAARSDLDRHIASAERVAPKDVRRDVTTYRTAVRRYLEARAQGEHADDLQAAQQRAGDAVNRYIEAHCT